MKHYAKNLVQVVMAATALALTGCDGAVRAEDRVQNGTEKPVAAEAACCPSEKGEVEDAQATACSSAQDAASTAEADAHEDRDSGHGAGHAMKEGVLWCGAHDVAEMECGICQPQLLPQLDAGQGLKVRLPSGAAAEKAGVEVGSPLQDVGARPQTGLLGEVAFNRNALAVVSPLATGVVESVSADVGDKVEAGDLLAVVRTPEIAEAKADYLDAKAQAGLAAKVYAREKDLHERGISARKDFDEAGANLRSAQLEVEHGELHLVNLGLTQEEVKEVAAANTASSLMPVRAPFSGTVVAREAVAGTRVEPGTELFRVADLSEMWMKLAIPEKLLANLREGSTVDVRFEAYPDTTFTGALTWIGYQVDPETRLVEARAVLANQHGLLRSGMFGEASPARATRLAGLAVPESAVQEIDGRDVVFAQLQSDLFEARVIQKGATESGRTTVLAGLDKDDAIALSGGYILKSEFMKSKFGAGCADH